jgi:Alpha/beta hydrolase domain
VPVATLNGDRTSFDPQTLGPGGQCQFVGAYDPSPSPEPDLVTLYSTHTSYVLHVTAATAQSVRAGYLRPVDGARIVLDALQAPLP